MAPLPFAAPGALFSKLSFSGMPAGRNWSVGLSTETSRASKPQPSNVSRGSGLESFVPFSISRVSAGLTYGREAGGTNKKNSQGRAIV